MTMNPLANDPEMIGELRERVARRDWDGARRLTHAMELHRSDPQQIFERDESYYVRMARRRQRPERPRR
jgi:hypothetical protein